MCADKIKSIDISIEIQFHKFSKLQLYSERDVFEIRRYCLLTSLVVSSQLLNFQVEFWQGYSDHRKTHRLHFIPISFPEAFQSLFHHERRS